MHTTPNLQFLKEHGQKSDSEIAAVIEIPLPEVRISLSDQSAEGETARFAATQFANGKAVEGMRCRVRVH